VAAKVEEMHDGSFHERIHVTVHRFRVSVNPEPLIRGIGEFVGFSADFAKAAATAESVCKTVLHRSPE